MSSMQVNVELESPLQDEVRALVAALNDHLQPLSPPEFQFQLTVDEMAGDESSVFVARTADGAAVGCGGLVIHPNGTGEVKRMFTIPAARGSGVGAQILDQIIELARAMGVDWLMLETGVGPGFAAAWGLYRSRGFTPRGPFLDYPASEWSAYFELRVRTRAELPG